MAFQLVLLFFSVVLSFVCVPLSLLRRGDVVTFNHSFACFRTKGVYGYLLVSVYTNCVCLKKNLLKFLFNVSIYCKNNKWMDFIKIIEYLSNKKFHSFSKSCLIIICTHRTHTETPIFNSKLYTQLNDKRIYNDFILFRSSHSPLSSLHIRFWNRKRLIKLQI